MALYEVVREIENNCARNQMRDVFFDEIETDDPLEAVRRMLKDERQLELSLERRDADNLTVYASAPGMTQRFIFTRI